MLRRLNKRSTQQPSGRRDRERRARTSKPVLDPARIFDVSQDAIFLWSEPGGIELWNQGAADLYGYIETEAIGQISHKLLRTKFPQPWPQIKSLLRSHGSWEGELHHQTRDGRDLLVWTRLKVVPNSGRKLLVLESTRDITAIKRDQAALEHRLREQVVAARFSLDALRATNLQTICDDATYILAHEFGADVTALFQVSSDGKTMLLRSGTGFESGQIGVAQIPVNEETAVGRAVHLNRPIIITDRGSDKHLRLPEFIRRQKIASSMAVAIQGRERPFGALSVATKTRRVFTAHDLRFLESISNILATGISRIQFEQEMRASGARLKGVVETAVDGIITIDERGIVETMNPAAEQIFGYSANEVIGNNVSMLMPEPYRSEHDGYLDRYLRTGERRIIGIGREVTGRRKDGSQFPMDLAVSATNLGNRQIFTGLVRDITERKRLEEEIIEISDYEQQRIGADLHDDLCQRLAAIRFACDALKQRLLQARTNDAIKRVEKIGEEVSAAIDHARTLARGMAPAAVGAAGLVPALRELAERVRKLSNVACTFRASEDIKTQDAIAATHLYRITQEAINNALKHGQATELKISLGRFRDKAVLSIKDNGSGFDTSAASQGMGLRTIAYRAGLIGAELEVHSTVGKGTQIICTFSLDL